MSTLLGYVQEFIGLLFISHDGGVATDGFVTLVSQTVIDDPILALPIVLMVVGLGVGVFSRIISNVRG